ncbi:Ig-like domain-containing protein [Taibaiella soli]|uniref:Secretion system C-terminal sorting domain-containing protein n=1 Tax=Taibaiella soli TaxID=1649169 RepID=A0A2W2B7P9_9BACT|nr:T9SS type A sorting domain-containing protein [Taibaiella soli]PZF71987.1 hypothetical protein DN068_15240 [Taibaiella soli]
MNRKFRIGAFLLVGLLSWSESKAQLTGTITVPSATYPDLTTVIGALNTQGVGTGGVVINITASNPQSAPTGGYLLGSATLNSSATAANPITINGNNNTVTANVGTSTTTDGIFIIQGVDYLTINGLNLADPNTASPTAEMEWGYALLKLNNTAPFDGCQNVTIKNCTITMNKANTASVGIYSGNHTAAATTALTITATTDAMNNGTFTGNTIQNTFVGIKLTGFAAPSPYSLYDQNNVIGAAGGGNTVLNLAPGSSANGSSAGIWLVNQNNANASYNTIDNAGGGGSGAAYTSYGIFHSTGVTSSFTANQNSITSTIYTLPGGANTVYGINSAATGTVSISNNTFQLNTPAAVNVFGAYYSILSSGANNLTEQNNNFSNSFGIVSPSTMGFISNSGNLTTTAQGNTVSNLSFASNSSATFYCYNSSGTGTNGSETISGNTFSNISGAPGLSMYGFYSFLSNANKTVLNNTVSNISGGSLTGFDIESGNVVSVTANSVNNMSGIGNSGGSGNVFGMKLAVSASLSTAQMNASQNTIAGLKDTCTASNVYGVQVVTGMAVNLYSNKIYNLENTGRSTGAGTNANVYGIYINNGTQNNVYNNFVSDLRDTGTVGYSTIFGIYENGGVSNLYYNTINLGSAAPLTGVGVTGISYLATAATNNIQNNIINIKATAGAGNNVAAIRRGVAGTAGIAPTAANFNVGNNIYYVTPAANNYIYAEGTTNATLVNAYAVSGVTANTAANIFNDPAFNTGCSVYKQFMAGRENGSFTENNLSAAGTGLFAPSGSSYAKSAATGSTTIPITTDYNGSTRATPADIGALQFTGTAISTVTPTIVFTALPTTVYCNNGQILTANITTTAGSINTTAGTAPRLYYKKATENNSFGNYPTDNTSVFNGWKYVEATGTAPNFTFNIDYTKLNSPIAIGDSISYFAVAQDNAATPRVGIYAAALASCPVSVNLTSAAAPVSATPAPFGYKLAALPSFAALATPDTVCVSGFSTIKMNTLPLGMQVQWQMNNGSGYTSITGATNTTYITPTLTSTVKYQAVLNCGSTVAATTLPDTVFVSNPTVTGTTPGNHCGAGTVVLQATGNAGANFNWYAASTAGAPLGTGASFTTAPISATTTFYVGAALGTNTLSTGISSTTSLTTASTTTGLVFDAAAPFVLKSVSVYVIGTAAGTVSVSLMDATGTNMLQMQTFNVNVGTSASPVRNDLPLNFSVPVGTGMRLLLTAKSTTVTGVLRDLSGLSFPYTVPNVMSITGGVSTATGTPVTTSYYDFYDWKVGVVCESARTPVVANITSSLPFSVSTAQTVCNNNIATISVTSPTANFSNYSWAPIANLYTDAAATIPYTGNSATTVYAKTTTPGNTNYIATASDPVSQCGAIDTGKVFVQPSAATVTSPLFNFCGSGSSVMTLTAAGNAPVSNIQWQNSPTGTTFTDIAGATSNTFTTPTLTATTYYRTQLKNSAGTACLQILDTVHIYNAQIVSNTPATRCGTGTVTLAATGSADATLNWYTSATGYTLAGTGASFTTPVLNSTTTYYVTAHNEAGSESIPSPTANDSTSNLTLSGGGLFFTVNTPATIRTVKIYPYSINTVPASIQIKITDSSNNVLFTGPLYTFTCGPNAGPQTVPVNISLLPRHYKMEMVSSGISYMRITTPNIGALSYPYSAPSGAIDITASYLATANTTYYMWFYNWDVTTGCNSTRVPVVATITTPPAFTITPAAPAICTGDTAHVSVSSANTGYTYNWTPGNLSGTTQALSPAGTTKYYVTGSDNSGGTNNGCVRVDSVTVMVNPRPNNALSLIGPSTFCPTDSTRLQAVGTFNCGFKWYNNGTLIPGANQPAYYAHTAGSYTVVITDTVSTCSATSAPKVITVYSTITPVVSASGATFTATGGTFTSYQWKLDGTDIPGATNVTYTATQPGQYTVVVTDANGCSTASLPYAYNVGIVNVTVAADMIKVYPNPVSTKVYIDAPVAVNVSLQSLDGKQILQQKNAKEIDMNDLADGVYMIRITDGNGQLIKVDKLVKTNR